jgi:hypothetical protein
MYDPSGLGGIAPSTVSTVSAPPTQLPTQPPAQSAGGWGVPTHNFYMSPLSLYNDPGMQLLYGGSDPFGHLTPEQQSQVSGLEQFVNSQQAAGGGWWSPSLNPYTNLDQIIQGINSTSDPAAHLGLLGQLQMNPEYLQGLDRPFEQNTQYTQPITGSKNVLAGSPTVGYDTPLMLVDNRTGQTVYTGAGFEALQQAAAAAQGISGTDKSKANWSLYSAAPGTEDWQQVARDAPDKSGLGIMADLALPVVGTVLGGPLGIVGAGLGAAAGSGLSSALQGRAFEDALMKAALSGTLAAGASALGGASLTGVATPAPVAPVAPPTGTGFEALQQAAAAAKGIATPQLIEVIRSAAPALSAGATGAVGALTGSALSNALSSLATPNYTYQTPPEMGQPIEVTADRLPAATPMNPSDLTGALTGLVGNTAPAITGSPTAVAGPDGAVIEVQGQAPSGPDLGVPAAVIGGGALAAAAAGGGAPPAGGTTTPSETPAEQPRSTLDQIIRALELGSIGIPLIEALLGGGGGGRNNATINPNGMRQLNPVFGAQLPQANLPSFAARAPRDVQTDWNTYAFRPEQSFFTDVPQRYAAGGNVSDGRSDDVPALLSRGEYVIDAETMALLGNGDPSAGADRMDDWRVNVRKHKGRELMKGAISPDAKTPEQYLGGGRV